MDTIPAKQNRDAAEVSRITAAANAVCAGAKNVPRFATAKTTDIKKVLCSLSSVTTLPMHCGSTSVLLDPTRKLPAYRRSGCALKKS